MAPFPKKKKDEDEDERLPSRVTSRVSMSPVPGKKPDTETRQREMVAPAFGNTTPKVPTMTGTPIKSRDTGSWDPKRADPKYSRSMNPTSGGIKLPMAKESSQSTSSIPPTITSKRTSAPDQSHRPSMPSSSGSALPPAATYSAPDQVHRPSMPSSSGSALPPAVKYGAMGIVEAGSLRNPWSSPHDPYITRMSEEITRSETPPIQRRLVQKKSPSRPPSSITSVESAGLARVSLESTRSTPGALAAAQRKGPGASTAYAGETRLAIDDTFVEYIRKELEAWEGGQNGALMLLELQGGTFGYGNRFSVETGRDVVINSQEDARNLIDPNTLNPFKTKHLLYYGPHVEQIGTKGCMSCAGVYFKISGNRVFCAHINASDEGDGLYRERHNMDLPSEDSHAYREIRNAVKRKMIMHSREHGWGPIDFALEHVNSIKIVSARDRHGARAVAAGVLNFLRVPYDEPDGPPLGDFITQAHGFIIKPGSNDDEESRGGKLFLRKALESRVHGREVFEDTPAYFDQVRLNDENGIPIGNWAYTVGDKLQWIATAVCGSEWKRGAFRKLAHDLDPDEYSILSESASATEDPE